MASDTTSERVGVGAVRTRLAVGVVALQATALLVAAVVILLGAGTGLAVATGVLALIFAAGLAVGVLGLRRGARWARSPLLTVQLLGIPVGVTIMQSGSTPVGVAVVLAALLTGALLVAS